MNRKIYFLLIPLFLFCFICLSEEGKVVKKIEVKGNRRVSALIILSRIRTKVGEPLSKEIIREDIKKIYGLGYFSDVSVDVEDYLDGVKVTFLVVEKPYIERIEIEGNKRLSKEDIQKAMVLAVGDIFREEILKEDLRRIRSLYEKKGFYKVEVDAKWEVEKGKVAIKIMVKEGPRIKVKEIIIKGNKNIPTRRILKVMKTRRAGLFWKGVFGKEILEEDKQRIKDLYQQEGYLEGEVIGEELKYDPSGRFLTITLTIVEGERYYVDGIEIKGNKLFSTEVLKKQISLKPGKPYNPFAVEKDVQALEDYYTRYGYITTRVWGTPFVDARKKKVKVRFEIEEGPRVYVRLIKIRGNIKTKDKVIRREILIKPGEVFDGEKVKRSREKIFNLGYFKEVRVRTQPTDKPNYYDLIFEVEERKTGIFAFALGYSDVERAMVYVEVQQSNFDITNPPTFVGGGQKLKLSATIGRWREDYVLSFTEPYFRDRPLSLGFDLYNTLREWNEYDERRRGGGIRIGKRLTPDLYLSTRYRYEMVRLFHLSGSVGEEIKKEEGRNDISSYRVGLVYDTRDNVFDPSKGKLTGGSIELAGGILGGDYNFYKWRAYYNQYIPWKKYVWSYHVEGGLVENYPPSTRVPLYERFYLGGPHTIRGYDYRAVGPEDEEGNPIGGSVFSLFNLEFKYPIVEVIKGIVFFDAGEVWESPRKIRWRDLKESVGVGVRIKTPIGPISLDYGYALEKKRGRWHFSIGYIF